MFLYVRCKHIIRKIQPILSISSTSINKVYLKNAKYDVIVIINPRRACAARVRLVVLCVCVSVCPFSLFCLLALLGVQREVSAATGREMQ